VTSHLETQKTIPRCGFGQHTISYTAYNLNLHITLLTYLLNYHKFIISKLILKITLMTPNHIF